MGNGLAITSIAENNVKLNTCTLVLILSFCFYQSLTLPGHEIWHKCSVARHVEKYDTGATISGRDALRLSCTVGTV